MFATECHCGNLKLAAKQPPASITRCNCSLCARLGALWAYYDAAEVEILRGDRPQATYAWGEKTMIYHRCGECGCTTHYTTPGEDGAGIVAINCRMAAPDAVEGIRIRDFDGLDSWRYLDE